MLDFFGLGYWFCSLLLLEAPSCLWTLVTQYTDWWGALVHLSNRRMMQKARGKYSWEKKWCKTWRKKQPMPYCHLRTWCTGWSYTLQLWEKRGDSESSHRAPSPSKEQQHILRLRLLSASHSIAENSAVFPCALCIDIMQLIKQWTPMQKPRSRTFTAEQEQRLLMGSVPQNLDTTPSDKLMFRRINV